MAFGKGRENDNPITSGTLPAPSSSSASPGGLTAFIDQGSEFEGKLSFKDTVRIDGRFRGEISSENTLIVGESGEIDATITSNTIAISGSVVGNVVAKQKVVIHKTGCVEGNIETPLLVVEEGARLDGQMKMGGGSKKSNPAPLKAVSGSGDAPKS